MTSDLAKAVQGFPLADQDDAFLVTHLLAGTQEEGELLERIRLYQQSLHENECVKSEIEKLLLSRHPEGRNFSALGSLVHVPPARADLRKGRRPGAERTVSIEPIETLSVS